MKLQPDKVEKPLRKLRQLLNAFPAKPRPEDVHSLRTQTRRLEAIVAALALDREKGPRRLLKVITPVRKAAGTVRDMDVLIGDVLALPPHQGDESAVRLIQHLARRRVKSARKLHRVVSGERTEIRKRLKRTSKLMREWLKDQPLDEDAPARTLVTELSHWPNLDENNLHLFRIRIKELRYMLQLTEQTDEHLAGALREVKDAIGEWHDRVELLRIAEKVLDPCSGGDLKRIAATRDEMLRVALATSNRVRDRYFRPPDGREASRRVLQMAAGD